MVAKNWQENEKNIEIGLIAIIHFFLVSSFFSCCFCHGLCLSLDYCNAVLSLMIWNHLAFAVFTR